MRKIKINIIFLLFLFQPLSMGLTYAEEEHHRKGFWGGIDVGVGLLEQSLDNSTKDDTSFYLGFQGGYALNPNFLIGVELSGWLLEAANVNDPRYGEGISQILAICRYYPLQTSHLFLKAGGGHVRMWNNRPGEPSGMEGGVFSAGVGYDFLVTDKIALTPFASYYLGNPGAIDYRAINFGIGVTFH